MKWGGCLLLFCLVFLIGQNDAATVQPVAGIDIGGEHFKIAAVTPTRSLDIVVNLQSKRKTATAVAFSAQGRLFGEAAINHASKSPVNSFQFLTSLLGIPVVSENEISVLNSKGTLLPPLFFPNIFKFDSQRNSLSIEVPQNNNTYHAEELIAHLLTHARDLLMNHAREFGSSKFVSPDSLLAEHQPIPVAFTIPVGFSYRQRQALIEAASLAKLNVKALIHAPLGAAVHHALDILSRLDGQNKTTGSKQSVDDSTADLKFPMSIIFFDLGATSSQGCLVRYSMVPTQSARKSQIGDLTLHVENLKCTSALSLSPEDNEPLSSNFGPIGAGAGSYLVDMLITEHLLKSLAAKAKVDLTEITSSDRIVKKVMKEASRGKLLLSFNKEVSFYLERIYKDLDLHVTISAVQLEEMIERSGMLSSIQRLAESMKFEFENLKLRDEVMRGVELLGGGWRVPAVYKTLEKIFGSGNLGQHCNGDEAMANGAALIAANMTKVYKLRPFLFTDRGNDRMAIRIHNNNLTTTSNPLKEKELFDKNSPWYVSQSVKMTNSDDLWMSTWLLPENNNNGDRKEFWKKVDEWQMNGMDTVASSIQMAGETKNDKKKEYDKFVQEDKNATWVNQLTKIENSTLSVNEDGQEVVIEDDNVKDKDGGIITTLSWTLKRTGLLNLDGAKASWKQTHVAVNKEIDSVTKVVEAIDKDKDKDNDKDKDKEEKDNDKKTEDKKEPSPVTLIDGGVNETTIEKVLRSVQYVEEIVPKTKSLSISEILKTVPSEFRDVHLYPLRMTAVERSAAKNRVEKLIRRDSELKKMAETRNEIERFIYDMRDILEDETKGMIVTGAKERQELIDKLTQTEDWLYEHGFEESQTVLSSKLSSLQNSMQNMMNLVKENENIPKIIDSIKDDLKTIQDELPSLKTRSAEHEQIKKLVDSLADGVANLTTWISTTETAFKKRDKKISFNITTTADKIKSKANEMVLKNWTDVKQKLAKIEKKMKKQKTKEKKNKDTEKLDERKDPIDEL